MLETIYTKVTTQYPEKRRIVLDRKILTEGNFEELLKMLNLPENTTMVKIFFDEIAYSSTLKRELAGSQELADCSDKLKNLGNVASKSGLHHSNCTSSENNGSANAYSNEVLRRQLIEKIARFWFSCKDFINTVQQIVGENDSL